MIVIDKTEPEIMKQAIIFMYTGKCGLTDQNGKDFFVMDLNFVVELDRRSLRPTRYCRTVRYQKFESLHRSPYVHFDWPIIVTGQSFDILVLIRQISMNNILQFIETAYKYNNSLLKQHCITYFLQHSKEIMDIHQTWKTFADEHPQIVAELFYWNVHPQDFAQTNQPLPDTTSQW